MSRKGKSGFTLVELLIVIAIIGILGIVLIPNLLAARNRADSSVTQGYIRFVIMGVESQRDYASASLPPASSTCVQLAGRNPEPGSVERCKYEPNTANETYTITAESVSGKIFHYDGNEIKEVPTY